ncbi:unnamed protein product [Prorocentrum cordatum]|uniref:Uncharacterized protein n=1 Tax=Prorocentrum cordatum TaxID=2364126 RepID=A0ABN9Q3Y0_9DINO|nr:unnamed protein product [Polarella glacialis]
MFDRKPGLGNMCTRFLLPPVADAPGPYLIIHDQAALTQNAPVSPADSTRELIGRVRASTPVEVLEVQRCQVLGREVLRGLLRDPPGWVTILDYDSGERWALAMSSAQG